MITSKVILLYLVYDLSVALMWSAKYRGYWPRLVTRVFCLGTVIIGVQQSRVTNHRTGTDSKKNHHPFWR